MMFVEVKLRLIEKICSNLIKCRDNAPNKKFTFNSNKSFLLVANGTVSSYKHVLFLYQIFRRCKTNRNYLY